MKVLTVSEAISHATENECKVYEDRKQNGVKTFRVRRGEQYVDSYQTEKGSRLWRVDGRLICTRAVAIVLSVDLLKQNKEG